MSLLPRTGTPQILKSRGLEGGTTVLSNRYQTLAVLGYGREEASAFERLSVAGRMLKAITENRIGPNAYLRSHA